MKSDQHIPLSPSLMGFCATALGSLLWAADALLLSSPLSVWEEDNLLLCGLALLVSGFVAGILSRRTRLGKAAIWLALLSPAWLVLGIMINPSGIGPIGPSAHHL